MASLVVLGAIYLEDKDSSQGMKNSVAMQSTKLEEKSSRMEAVQKKQAALAIFQGLRIFAAPTKFRKAANFRSPYENCLPCESFLPLFTCLAAFSFLTFLSLFDCLPDLPPL